jgi:hypothetical protein
MGAKGIKVNAIFPERKRLWRQKSVKKRKLLLSREKRETGNGEVSF